MDRAKRFQLYDYDAETNKKIYGTERPPEYPVGKINVPFQIVYSPNDALFGHEVHIKYELANTFFSFISKLQDAWLLYRKLRGAAKMYKPYNSEGFNHIDYMYGKDIVNLYRWIVKKINDVNT